MEKLLFDPGLEIGQTIENAELGKIFKCSNMGGMRSSKVTNTLVIVSDYTKGPYHDKWIGGVLHYTGMGKSGDQDIHWSQNATLAESPHNGVDVHLFEVIDPGEYIYCGRVELVDKPYTDTQLGEDGHARLVWMFPVKPVSDSNVNNNVKKPEMFVFKDMEDYKARGKIVDAQYARLLVERKKQPRQTKRSTPTSVKIIDLKPNPGTQIHPEILGRIVRHKSFGNGVISGINGSTLIVDFDKVGTKKIGYEFCMKNNIIEFVDESE